MWTIEAAKDFVENTHYCDFGTIPDKYGFTHPHDGCECPCSVCFSFWHWNVFRFEEAKRFLKEHA